MKKFHAVGTDNSGRKYAGTFEAESEAEARRMLASEGYEIITLEELSADEALSGEIRKKAALQPENKKGKNSAGKAYAGGAAQKKAGTGTALIAAALVLSGLLAVMGYLSAKKNQFSLDQAETERETAAPEAEKPVVRFAPSKIIDGQTEEGPPGGYAEDGAFEAAVEAEAADVQIIEYQET